MVEYVCYLLLAVACFLGYVPIDVGSADGVIDLAMEVAQLIIYCVYLVMVIDNSYRLIVSYSMLVHNVLPP